MAKIEQAYSIELGEKMDAIRAHELWCEGILKDKTAFQCKDPNCVAQITCANMDKKKSEMKRTPYFQCYSQHSTTCKCKNDYQEANGSSRKNGNKKDVIYSNNIDYLLLERPENHKQIQRTAEIKQQRDVQENGNQESKKVDRNIHISECYSITPIVTKYLHYRFAEGENYVRIGKSTILYSKLFVPIDNVDMTNISGFRNIYFGKARLFHKNEKYRVCFTEKIGSENSVLENYTVMCVIPEEMVENYLFRNGKTEELKEAVNSKKEYDVYLYGKLNKGKKGEILFVNITSLDFLDIR